MTQPDEYIFKQHLKAPDADNTKILYYIKEKNHACHTHYFVPEVIHAPPNFIRRHASHNRTVQLKHNECKKKNDSN